MKTPVFAWVALLFAASAVRAEKVTQLTQYGITWTFAAPCEAGRFVTGDYWVVGPVTVTGVSPAPGPRADDGKPRFAGDKSRYGAVALVDDDRMRNGSMILTGRKPVSGQKNTGTGFAVQGYDSRLGNYAPESTVVFPLRLEPDRTLISTISAETTTPEGKLATPFVLGEKRLPLCSSKLPLALRAAAVLTCLPSAPPADAFRPPYAGVEKPLYRAASLRRDRLPRLAPVEAAPDWAGMERLFERPWLDHTGTWLDQYMLPGENQPNYGREFARLSSLATAMLLLDVPAERKETLLLRYIQLGIDLAGSAQTGRQWFSDGGHWQGRKWPILFASILLDAPELRAFPRVDPAIPVYSRVTFSPTPGVPEPTTLFQEDLDTYYGRGAEGQNVLWQVVFHTGAKPPYEQKARADYDPADTFVSSYRFNNSGSWIGAALAARWMKAQALWNHDAFFDYVDRWMQPDEPWTPPKWLPRGCTRSVDLFVEQMWAAHRASAPAQPGGKDNLKWVWLDGGRGTLVPNDPATALSAPAILPVTP